MDSEDKIPGVNEATVYLKPGREKSVREGHPWIFSGGIAMLEGAKDAPVVLVRDSMGKPLGIGFHSPLSQIRVRMIGRPGEQAESVSRSVFLRYIQEALILRSAILPPDTTGFRVLNAEGDGLPGWTVDRFGDVLVSQITVSGLEALRNEAYDALSEVFPGLSILQVNDLPARRAEGLAHTGIEKILGDPPAEEEFLEYGFRFMSELSGGQKTGFYCDQRENRRRVELLSSGRTVLDLFAHSGAFGLYALRGGATRVVYVESSARLIERGRQQAGRNGYGEGGEWVKANVFEDLRERTEQYGLVVCDPPPLVRKRPDLDSAARAYKDLNRLALRRVEPGGFLLTFSCSGAVDSKLFRQILFAAAVEAGVRVSLLEPLAAAPDHPVDIRHPQGEYLKGWLVMVRGAV